MWERDIVPFFPDKDLRERTKARIKANIYNFIPAKYRCKAWPLVRCLREKFVSYLFF